MWCSTSPCSEEEHRAMQTEFSECRSNFNTRFHARDYNDDDLCQLLDQIINFCGKKWQQCHSQQEIRKMKEMHMEAFIHHWERDSNIESCQAVKLFRESLLMRNDDSSPAELSCTDAESSDSMAQFSSCSHATSTHIYTSISDSTPSLQISGMLCAGLNNISTVCPVHLKLCFAAEDVEEIRLQHIREMRKFFNRLMKDRIPADALDDCGEKKKYMVPTTTSTTTTTTTTTTTITTTPRKEVKQEVFKDVQEISKNDLPKMNFDEDETNDIEKYEAQLDGKDGHDTKSVRSSNMEDTDFVEDYPNEPLPKTSTKSIGDPTNSQVKTYVSNLVLFVAIIPILSRL